MNRCPARYVSCNVFMYFILTALFSKRMPLKDFFFYLEENLSYCSKNSSFSVTFRIKEKLLFCLKMKNKFVLFESFKCKRFTSWRFLGKILFVHCESSDKRTFFFLFFHFENRWRESFRTYFPSILKIF